MSFLDNTRINVANALSSKGVHYGWAMAVLAFMYALFSSAALGVPGVLIIPMSKDLGWTLGELSAPLGLRLALFGLIAPFAGGLMLRYGPRKMVGASGVLLIIGLLIGIATTEKWQLWLGMGILLGIAPGLTAMQMSTVISTRWFVKRQGLVLGILSGSVATGTLIFMPLAAWVSENWGWRIALLIPTIGSTISWLLFIWLARDRPQELNLPPFGESQVQPLPPVSDSNFIQLTFKALKLGVTNKVFWILTFTFAVCGISSFGLTQAHLVPFCGDLGVPLTSAAWLLTVIGICDLIGTIGSGWLSDRYDNRWLLVIYYGLRGVGLVWLVQADVSMAALTLFSIIYGLDFIATVPPTVRLTVNAFGREMGPAIFGWIFAAHHVSAGLMAFGAGVSRDILGTYAPSFFMAGVLCFIAVASLYGLRTKAKSPI